jgi:hypothetical protein
MLMALFLAAIGSATLEPGRLSGPDLRDYFAGTSVYGRFTGTGQAWAERTTRDGRVYDLLRGGRHSGAWAVQDDALCFIYFGPAAKVQCYAVALEGGNPVYRDARTGEPVAKGDRIVRGRR